MAHAQQIFGTGRHDIMLFGAVPAENRKFALVKSPAVAGGSTAAKTVWP
jgi:hypothetical protein